MALSGFEIIREIVITNNENTDLSNWQVGPILFQGNTPGAANYLRFLKFKTNGEDWRVTDRDNTTPLSYIIVDWNSGAKTAEVFIKIPLLKANEELRLFIWGDNAGASDASSYDNTMTKIVDATAQGLWHMDEGSPATVTVDSSSNGYDATLISTIAWVGNDGGNFGGRIFSFSTGDQLNPGAGGELQTASSVPNLYPRTGNYSVAGWTELSSGNGSLLDIQGGGNQVTFGVTAAGKLFFIISSGGPVKQAESNSVFVDGGKHHIGVTWDFVTKGILFYVDGALVASTTIIDFAPPVLDVNPAVAARIGVGLNGKIDELAVYQRLLTAGEFSALYNRRSFTANQPTWTVAAVSGTTTLYFPTIDGPPTTELSIKCLETYKDKQPLQKHQSRQLTPAGFPSVVTSTTDEIQFLEINASSILPGDKDDLVDFIQDDADIASNTFDLETATGEFFSGCRFWNAFHSLESIHKNGFFKDKILIRVDPT